MLHQIHDDGDIFIEIKMGCERLVCTVGKRAIVLGGFEAVPDESVLIPLVPP